MNISTCTSGRIWSVPALAGSTFSQSANSGGIFGRRSLGKGGCFDLATCEARHDIEQLLTGRDVERAGTAYEDEPVYSRGLGSLDDADRAIDDIHVHVLAGSGMVSGVEAADNNIVTGEGFFRLPAIHDVGPVRSDVRKRRDVGSIAADRSDLMSAAACLDKHLRSHEAGGSDQCNLHFATPD